MNRNDLLKKMAMLPVVGLMLSNGPTVETEESAVADGEEMEHVFAGVTSGGRYFRTTRFFGWPTLEEIKDFAQQGFDRLEVFKGGVIHYQDTTWPGRVPVGWDTLEHAGFINR